MKRSRIFCALFVIIFLTILPSCGCGPNFLYNWRPKPWVHPFIPDSYSGLDTLINIGGYYVSPPAIDTVYYTDAYPMGSWTRNKTDYFRIYSNNYSIIFYNNGLCASLSTKVSISENNITSILDTLYSNQVFTNKNKNIFYKNNHTSWGTYAVCNDTIKTYLIENLSGCDGTRKNIISMEFLISDNKSLKQTYVSSSNKEYGYKKRLNIPFGEFHLIEKRDSTDCPYLKKDWFYRKDKIK